MTVYAFPRDARMGAFSPGGGSGEAVIDAEFIVLGPAGEWKEASRETKQIAPRPGLPGLAVLESPERGAVRLFSQRGSWGFWLGGLFLAALCFWVSGGHAWLLPQTAKAAPAWRASNLSLALLGSETEATRGKPVLRIEAEARNAAARAQALPPLAILITTGKDVVMRYQVAPPPDGIGPGGRQRYATRLPVPADGVKSVSVAFAP